MLAMLLARALARDVSRISVRSQENPKSLAIANSFFLSTKMQPEEALRRTNLEWLPTRDSFANAQSICATERGRDLDDPLTVRMILRSRNIVHFEKSAYVPEVCLNKEPYWTSP